MTLDPDSSIQAKSASSSLSNNAGVAFRLDVESDPSVRMYAQRAAEDEPTMSPAVAISESKMSEVVEPLAGGTAEQSPARVRTE
jgi:hypothetical protein